MENSQRVFIRGNKDRGEEVIKVLTDLGGRGGALDGLNKDCIYFIDHDGVIDFAYFTSEIALIIMDNYTEIHLTEQWKDGDVLVSRSNSQVMALYEFVSDKEADLFNAYIHLNGDMITLHSLEVRKHFRIATDQEVERFYELLHKHHKDWDAEKKQLVDWKWKPKKDGLYWTVTSMGNVDYYYWEGSFNDEKAFDFGNCFRTKAEAETAAERVKKALKGI